MNYKIREKKRKITFLDNDNNIISSNVKNKSKENYNNNNYNDNNLNENHLKLLNSNLNINSQNETQNNSNLYKPMRRVKFLNTTKIPFDRDLKEKYKINYNINNDTSNSNIKVKNNKYNNNPILSLKFEPFSGRHSFKEIYPENYLLTLDDSDDFDFYENNNRHFFKRSSFLKKTKEKKYFQEETEEDPLQIPKEDEIFNELAKRKKTIRLTKIKLHIIEKKKKVIKKKKIKGKNLKEKLLNRVYEKNPVANKKMMKVKKSKEKINLNNYQNLLLKTAEPILSKDSFNHLDKIFNRLRTDNNDIYEYNYPYIKDLENKEKDIINNINQVNNNYYKFLNKYKTLNEFYTNKTLQLPKINFRRIINKEKYKILNTNEF